MNHPNTITRSRLLGGTTWIALAQASMLPTGFVTVVYLTHRLGADGYGLFALAASIVTWLEWGVSAVFGRATIKFVGEATNWQMVATTALKVQLGISLLVALGLAVLAPAIAALLHEPILTPLLWLFALEIPLFNLVQVHQNILTGLGRFGVQALVSAIRWTARLLFIVVLVEVVGLSTQSAVVGSVVSLLFSLAVCRCFIRPSLWQTSSFPTQNFASYATPLFLSALALQLYERLDIVALKALGGTAEAVGFYAVAQNLALLGRVFSPALASVLLASISQLLYEAKIAQCKQLSHSAMRAVLLHIPFIALAGGSASEIVQLLFGERLAPAAPLFTLLMLAAIAAVMMAVTSAILIASEKPWWALFMAVPLPAIALVCHLFLIPRAGMLGAALGTLLVTVLGAWIGVVAVYIRWEVWPPVMTLGRSCLVGGLVAIAAAFWPATGFWLCFKLMGLSLAILLALWLLGEFTQEDRLLLASVLPSRFKPDSS